MNRHGQRFVSYSPLHEGIRNGVGSSSGMALFTGAEDHFMNLFFSRDRISSVDAMMVISIEEYFQFFKF